MTKPDLYSLAVGLAIVVIGTLLLLKDNGTIDLGGGLAARGVDGVCRRSAPRQRHRCPRAIAPGFNMLP